MGSSAHPWGYPFFHLEGWSVEPVGWSLEDSAAQQQRYFFANSLTNIMIRAGLATLKNHIVFAVKTGEKASVK